MHLLHFGGSLTRGDLSNCKDLAAIRDAISAMAKQKPNAKRLLFRGWFQDSTDGKALASLIDDLDPRPIYIDSFDLHAVWCNSTAIVEMGLKDVPNMKGGEVGRDENGNPNGYIAELPVMTIVIPFLAQAASNEENTMNVRLALRAYNDAGYTSVAELAMDEGQWQVLLGMREELTLQIAAYWLISPSETEAKVLNQVDKAIEMKKLYNETTSPDLRIQGIKLICDGTVDGCTAALSKPYSHNSVEAEAMWDASTLEKVVRKATDAGLQCALHAIGDKAVTLAVDALAAGGSPTCRHRIEHLELSSSEDAQRLGKLGILASVQPVHSDPHLLRAWPKFIGEDRCQRAFAYKEFADHGAHIAIGTDAPTAPHLPFPNLYNATTRRSAIQPELQEKTTQHFKLDLFEAMAAVTRGAAYSIFAEHRTGTIEVGKKADLAIAEMKWNAGDLLQAEVQETWQAGKCVFRKA